MSTMTIEAPAKVNVSLRVLGKRDDGFHAVDTRIAKLPGLADRLTFSDAEEFAFTCDDPTVPGDESNLVVKAARSFAEVSGRALKVAIHLEKRVPHGAGLGGGSSDAAATLRVLNEREGGILDETTLHRIAGELGSDVPVFLLPGAARCTGRGEIVVEDHIPSLTLLLLKPWFGVSTPDAYGRWKDAKEIPGMSYGPQQFPWGELVNDLERPVFSKHLFLATCKRWLLKRPEVKGALMSGSGSTMLVVIDRLESAEAIITAARAELDSELWAWAGETAE